MIFLSEEELLPIISKRIQVIGREEITQVDKLMPVWQAIALGGLLKLVKNRIRYNALMNFLKLKVNEKHLEILSNPQENHDDILISYGESMIGILFPDKKSAIAIGVSQKLQCKSSFLLKGLTYLLGVLMIQLKRYENDLKDFNTFCDYFISYKNVFSEHISPDLQKTIIEILLLNDVLKSDTNLLFSDSFEESEELEDQAFSRFLKNKILLIFISIVLIGSLVFYLIRSKSENTVNIDDTEEIIPIDSLNKLNDSLTQVAVDSTKLQSDSTVSLFWTNGKSFTIPKQSTIVSLHTFLTDSTVKDPITLNCFEVTFENESDQILSSKDYFFKRFSEGLQLNKDIKLEILTFSDKDSKSALKRGFFIKNRFVGEGISPKRISVVPSIAGISPDANVPLNAQVVFRVLK